MGSGAGKADPNPECFKHNFWDYFFSFFNTKTYGISFLRNQAFGKNDFDMRFLAYPETIKHLPTMWEDQVQSLGLEDILEKEMTTHSSTLA